MTKKPWFWIVLLVALSVGGCCVFSVLVVGLGAMTDDAPAAKASPSSGAYVLAVEVARGTTLTEPLVGGRWVAQYGSLVDHVVSRVGSTAWVQTNSSGSLYELVFVDDGTYEWTWSGAVTMYGSRSQSFCKETGTWSLDGTRLTLTPESQRAQYSNASGSQEKEDEDLRPRAFDVVDLTLETLPSDSAPVRRFGGLSMRGPKAAWDTGPSDVLSLTLQRLPE
ncbi:MAG TPA: hypothetical protein VGD87_18340 [Archangium sp.]